MERDSVLKMVDASSKTLLQVLESSIRLGEVVIIEVRLKIFFLISVKY